MIGIEIGIEIVMQEEMYIQNHDVQRPIPIPHRVIYHTPILHQLALDLHHKNMST